MRRIQNGPVKGISLKIQEEERERRLDFVPKESNINLETTTEVDQETYNYLEAISPGIVSKLQVQQEQVTGKKRN